MAVVRQIKRLLANQHGFSLVEIIVAFVVMLIVITAVTPLFTSSYTGVFRAGRKSSALQQAQSDIEAAIRIGTTLNSNPLNISFPGVPSITLQGKIETIIHPTETHNVAVTVFLPKR